MGNDSTLQDYINRAKNKDNALYKSRTKPQLIISSEELAELTKQYLEQGGTITQLPPGSAQGTSFQYENHMNGYNKVDAGQQRPAKIHDQSNHDKA